MPGLACPTFSSRTSSATGSRSDVFDTDEQLERELRAAAAEIDVVLAKKGAGIALDQAYQRHVDKRPPLGVKEQIENFAKFLGKLAPSVFLNPETVPIDSLRDLKALCSMVLTNAEEALTVRLEA